MRQKRARAGRTPSYWPYDQVVTECLILRPRAMQVINCAAGHGQQRRQAVARRDSMAASTPNSHVKTSKKCQKRKKREKIGACGGLGDPISPPHGYPLGPSPPPRGGLGKPADEPARAQYISDGNLNSKTRARKKPESCVRTSLQGERAEQRIYCDQHGTRVVVLGQCS